MTGHIIEIVVMLLVAAVLGILIGWLFRRDKISKLETYIKSLEEKNNRMQAEINENEKFLIDCQTNRKKAVAEKEQIEKLLIECQGKLTVSEIESAKNKIKKQTLAETEKKTSVSKQKSKTQSKKKKEAKADNLTKIEGIGPKISSILKESGIETFKKLSTENPEKIRGLLLEKGGKRYSMHNPETWPEQAKLAADNKWDELSEWQKKMKGGRKA